MNWKTIIALFLVLVAAPVAFAAGSEDKGNSDMSDIQPVMAQVQSTVSTGITSAGDMVRAQNQIQLQDMEQVASRISIRAGFIESDGESEAAAGKQVQAQVSGRDITIEPTQERVQLREGSVVVNTTGVQFREGSMYFGDNEVRYTPEQIREKLQYKNTTSFELKENNGKAVYAHQATEQRKLFGFISMRATMTEVFDATTGELTKEARPWWYAFSANAE